MLLTYPQDHECLPGGVELPRRIQEEPRVPRAAGVIAAARRIQTGSPVLYQPWRRELPSGAHRETMTSRAGAHLAQQQLNERCARPAIQCAWRRMGA